MNYNEKRKRAAINCYYLVKLNFRNNKFKCKRALENTRIAWHIWKIWEAVGTRRRKIRNWNVRQESNNRKRIKRIKTKRIGVWKWKMRTEKCDW